MDVKGKSRIRSALVRLAGATSAAALLLGISGLAGNAVAQGTPKKVASQPVTIAFNIPAQSLNSAILSFADKAGIQVFYDTARVKGLKSSGATGTLTSQAALARILAGTGLSYRFTGPTSVTISGAQSGGTVSAGDATALAPIIVQGSAEAAWGPVRGYVATQSATGTKTDTPLIRTPQTISVVGRKEMDTRQTQSVSDALSYVAGVEQPLGAESRKDNLYSRGFLASQYLNGLRLTDGSWGINQIDPYLLERVERIGGPASVLYGQASPGGIISMVSKMPTAEPFHELSIQGGNYDHLQGMFDFSGPVDPDGQLLYRLTGMGRLADGQIDFSKDRRLAVAPALTWKPDEDTSLTLLGSYQYDPDLGQYYTLPSQGTVLPNPNGKIPTSRYIGDPGYNIYSREISTVGYSFEHKFNDTVTVRQNLRYIDLDAKFGGVFALGLQPDMRTLNRYAMYDRDQLGQFTVDNQAEIKFDTGSVEHKLLVGLDYQRTTLEQTYGFDFSVPAFDIFNPKYNLGISQPAITGHTYQVLSQLGAYAQDQVTLGKLSVVGGLRYDWADTDTDDRINGTSQDVRDRKPTGRLGAVYQFDNGIAPYVSYSTSFQPASGTDRSGNPFKPTAGKQYEVGVKYQPVGYDSFITLSAFDLRQTNVTTPDTSPGGTGFSVQTGEVHSRGVELSAVASLDDDLNMRFSYAYLLAVNSETNDPTTLGKQLVGSSKNAASLWLDYKVSSGPLTGLGLGAGVRYRGERYGDDANTFKVPSFALVDAAISYDFGAATPKMKGWKAALNATNLFDKEYVAACNGDTLCYYGDRRRVLGTLTYQW